MANYKLNEHMVMGMSEGDKLTLFTIYLHRCLTPSLIIDHLYRHYNIPPEIADHRLDAMILDKLIEAVHYGGHEDALFLTPYGVKTVTSLYGEQLIKMYKPGLKFEKLPTYWDLKMRSANINHQIHLNQFCLEFEDYVRNTIEYEYYDEKFMPPASDFVMPDGMISLPDRLLFLEMDMGTEAIKRLSQKWNSYRMFLNSPNAYYQNKPITMFFILDGIAKILLRKKTIMRSLMTHLGSRITGNFEAYFETPERSHEIIRTKYLKFQTELATVESCVLAELRNRYGFKISCPSFLPEIGLPNAYYIKRLNEHGKLSIVGNRPQEFILDIWLDQRFSVFQSLASHAQIESKLLKITNRRVPYLLIVPSFVWVNMIPQIAKSFPSKEVFFTTPDRLATHTKWHEALFQIDQIRNLFHFYDDSLSACIHEKRLTRI